MKSLRLIVAKPKNRQVLSWIGGGIAAVAAGAFAVVTYLWPAQDTPKSVCVQQGISIGGKVSQSTISNNSLGSTIAQPCIETKK